MRVLYESLVLDPTRNDSLKGPAHVIYESLLSAGVDLHVLGPKGDQPALWERLFRRIYRRSTGRRYLRFPVSQAARFTRRLNSEVARVGPDAILTMFPPAISRYSGDVPILYRLDATYRSLADEYPRYGYGPKIADRVCQMQRQACERSRSLLTHSTWCLESLVSDYGLSAEKITTVGCPGGLRPQVIPQDLRPKSIEPGRRIRLLSVGFDAYRKGFDIAEQTLEILVERGLDVELTICGIGGRDSGRLSYVGPFDKSRDEEERRYVELYQRSDLLFMPTRWEPWGMVVSEAAAFGLPTIIRDVAGTSSAVIDDQTGVLVSRNGGARDFARAIENLIADPGRYRLLSTEARARYERELSWEAFGRHLLQALDNAIRHERAV